MGYDFALPRKDSWPIPAEYYLFVQGWPKNRNDKVCKIGSAFIQLQPTHYAVLCEILRHSRFLNSQVLRKLRLDRL